MDTQLLFIGNLGPTEIIVILVVVLLLFGGRKIPQLAKEIGSGIREFRNTMGSSTQNLSLDDDMHAIEPEPKRTTVRKKTPAKSTVRKTTGKKTAKKVANKKETTRKKRPS